MDKLYKIAMLVCIEFILCVTSSYPQSSDYKFRHLTTKDGLPSNQVNSIMKDSQGFMWFGTDEGLARYDGYNFKTYLIPGDSISGTESQKITEISEDPDGNFWIGTSQQGLQLFDRIYETFSSFINDPNNPNSLSNNSVNAIYKDEEGIIWIGTDDGLNRFDPNNRKFHVFKQKAENAESLVNQITEVFEDKSGTFWIGTHDGLYCFDRKKGVFNPIELAKEIPLGHYRKINCIVEDRDNMLWIGTNWGMFKYDSRSKEIVNYLPRELSRSSGNRIALLSNLYAESIVESNLTGRYVLWIATSWGLNKFDIDKGINEKIWEDQNNPQSLSSNYLKEVYLDNTGLLWIATHSSGVEVLYTRTNIFHSVMMKDTDDEFHFQASSFHLDSEKMLWVGAIDEGLFQYDKNFKLIGNYTRFQFDPDNFDRRNNNRISCIYENSDKSLLLGFYEWGLVNFNKTQNTFLQIELENNTNAPKPKIVDNIILDKFGKYWIGTNAGLYIKNYSESIVSPAHIIGHDILNKAEIKNIFEDRKGNLWISTLNNGLYSLTLANRPSMDFINYRDNNIDANGFLGNYVSALYEDQKGTLWVGTDKGLNKFNPLKNNFEPDTNYNKDYDGLIFRIYGDGQDNLWLFHSTKGLMRYQPNSGKKNKVKIFDVLDGLPFDKFNTSFSPTNSFYQSNDGRLFLGASAGTGYSFFWFHPDSIEDNSHVPIMVITNFNVGNKNFLLDSSIHVKKHIKLKYNENFFSFEFAALDYIIPEKNQYAYFLEGYEDDWNYSGNRRFANYTGVPPGDYIFRMKGSNNDGYWNEQGTTIQVTILPPFWKTWWAYIIYGVVILSIIYSIIHYYLRRQRLLDRLALEQVEAEKLKELDGLKTRFFTNISHEFRTPLTLILGPVQQLLARSSNPSDKQNLSIIQKNAYRLKYLVNQLLSLSKLESGKMVLQATEVNLTEFVRNCLQSFESLASHKKIELSFSADQDEITAFIDKEKMTQVLNNLLSNAFKFTPEGGRVAVEVVSRKTNDLPENSTVISIADTGNGIAPGQLDRIFDRFYQVDDSISRGQEGSGIGLAIAREMVKLHHGEIKVESEVGKGTTFFVLLPLGGEHLEMSLQSLVFSRPPPRPSPNLGTSPPVPLSSLERGKRGSGGEGGEAPLLLIVEDNPDMRTFIRGYFAEDYNVMEAENGEVGLNMAFEQIPDIVVSDVMMPEMDGYQFCRRMKNDERTSHIPVILLTARAGKDSRLEGLETGADDFITKPFDGEELQVRVKNLADQREKLREHYRKGFELIADKTSQQILSMDEKFLKKAQSVVEANLSDPEYGVERFASDMALSRFQLHRKLSALVNQPITEFIRTIRLNYAVGLLKQGAGTISEIAYDAGFNNPTYFTISFKKQFGISPKEFLQQLEN